MVCASPRKGRKRREDLWFAEVLTRTFVKVAGTPTRPGIKPVKLARNMCGIPSTEDMLAATVDGAATIKPERSSTADSRSAGKLFDPAAKSSCRACKYRFAGHFANLVMPGK